MSARILAFQCGAFKAPPRSRWGEISAAGPRIPWCRNGSLLVAGTCRGVRFSGIELAERHHHTNGRQGQPEGRSAMTSFMRGLRRAAMLALGAAMLVPQAHAQSAPKTIKFIPEADLRSLDPIWTTAYITRNHGYMVYDTLFALDEHLQPRPQMVDRWTASEDRLTYTFTLRDGLKIHDGAPVRSADCIASLQRWMKRDGLGQVLGDAVAEIPVTDDKTFAIVLKRPFPLLLEALGKLSSNVPFIMPERIAKTDPNTQITDPTGSGPFKFVKEEWVPGNKAVYVKNTDYVPRAEPPSWAAGGKVVKVDRVE